MTATGSSSWRVFCNSRNWLDYICVCRYVLAGEVTDPKIYDIEFCQDMSNERRKQREQASAASATTAASAVTTASSSTTTASSATTTTTTAVASVELLEGTEA